MTFAPIIAGVGGLYVAIMYALRRSRGLVARHPYRNPFERDS
jgi:hypothetical protein